MLDNSSEAAVKSETIMLANDYGFDLQDAVDLDDVVEHKNSSRSKPPLPSPDVTPTSDLHPSPLK